MKRIIMMLALAAFLVAALSVSALSAFAAGGTPDCPPSYEPQGQHCVKQAGPNEFRIHQADEPGKECTKRHPSQRQTDC